MVTLDLLKKVFGLTNVACTVETFMTKMEITSEDIFMETRRSNTISIGLFTRSRLRRLIFCGIWQIESKVRLKPQLIQTYRQHARLKKIVGSPQI